jgi:hypothetical protein
MRSLKQIDGHEKVSIRNSVLTTCLEEHSNIFHLSERKARALMRLNRARLDTIDHSTQNFARPQGTLQVGSRQIGSVHRLEPLRQISRASNKF